MKEKVEVGSVVTLKSGGPNMTVNNIDPGVGVECCWFVDGCIHSSIFSEDALFVKPSGTN